MPPGGILVLAHVHAAGHLKRGASPLCTQEDTKRPRPSSLGNCRSTLVVPCLSIGVTNTPFTTFCNFVIACIGARNASTHTIRSMETRENGSKTISFFLRLNLFKDKWEKRAKYPSKLWAKIWCIGKLYFTIYSNWHFFVNSFRKLFILKLILFEW